MSPSGERTGPDRAALIVGLALLAISGLVYWNASQVTSNTIYGLGPRAMPYVVAIIGAILGICHLVVALRGGFNAGDAEPADWGSIGWIVLGLVAMIASVGLGVGFIPSMTVLFASTARAFGRTAFLVDIAIGFVTAVSIYLIFTKLLTLGLPRGPLEQLL